MRSQYKRYSVLLFVIVLCIAFPSVDIIAQCPMCRAAAETNLSQGGTAGKGLNTGILYMLALPYLLITTIGYLWWRNKKGESKAV